MWYFTWIIGIGFAVLLAIINAIWLEHAEGRLKAFAPKNKDIKDNIDRVDIKKTNDDSDSA